jgi:malate synthase
VNGTRAAVRTVIRYRHGVLSGRGASLLDGYMEDLATDRIYRLMIAQRVIHRDLVHVLDGQGTSVKHTPEFITQLFDEELNRLLRELPSNTDPQEADRYRRAREISEAMIVNGEFNPI